MINKTRLARPSADKTPCTPRPPRVPCHAQQMPATHQRSDSGDNAHRPRMRSCITSSIDYLIGHRAWLLEPLAVLRELLTLVADARQYAFLAQRERYLLIR